MAAPEKILELVETFSRNLDAYKRGQLNETEVRVQFIDPMFKALGWDVHNEQGYAEAYKEVVHEDSLRIGGAVKAPDYAYRIGGARKFFLEAKKPAINIKEDISPAYQLRRYAWSAKLPLSILTDFEEFAVYDCRIRPVKTDKASKARVMYIRFEEYAERWHEIADIFAKESILKGSFDKYAESHKKKRGTAEVDAAFLSEIEAWRESLAKNIALRNPDISQRDLNHAVQQTIDRIIFLRICEDRGIEDYGRLMALQNGKDVYKRLFELFHKADARYNSGLFHFHSESGRTGYPDELTPSLAIDDNTLKPILKSLYFPDSPYEFSVLPADILGQTYEQFLGKVIRLTSGHRAVVEDKPEVKKSGGVYYTPTYIVDYIVQHTVGKLLEDKTARQAANIRICDPACGSGSFLLGAYQYLLDWYRDWYANNEPMKWCKGRDPKIYQGPGGDWRLSTSEKKRILLNNIYGVDIDHQAVEVTKLSLLLKVLENETQDTLQRELFAFHERALPDLSNNIKCGNSLIGPDFYDQQDLGLMGEEERYRINVFDWQAEFPDIFAGKNPGFDAVIGNPPWISLTGKFRNEILLEEEVAYLIAHFKGNTYMPNMYEYFVAQGLNLVGPSGRFSFIVPDRLGYNAQFVQLRRRILIETRINALLYKVPFPGITADTLVFVIQKAKPASDWHATIAEYNRSPINRRQSELLQHPSHAFECFESEEVMALVTATSSCPLVKPLGELCDSTSGFGGKSHLIQGAQTDPQEIPVVKGDSIGRYEFKKQYWFNFRRENITGRTTDRVKLGAVPKVLIRKTGNTIIATFDDSGIFPEQSLYFLFGNQTDLDFKYLLGLLNSRLINAYFRAKLITNIKSIAQIKKVDLDQLPIRTIDFSDKSDKARHDRMVELVERMLVMHKQLAAAKTGQDKTMLQRQIDTIDRQIDQLVYELYGLTGEEIAIVEESSSNA